MTERSIVPVLGSFPVGLCGTTAVGLVGEGSAVTAGRGACSAEMWADSHPGQGGVRFHHAAQDGVRFRN